MRFSISDISKTHPIVLAAKLMHDLYSKTDGMYEPCQKVLENFPELTPEQVMCLWIGINISECDLEAYNNIELIK